MDLRNAKRGALSVALSLFAVSALVPMTGHAETSLWLVRPLYPGQEALVSRTESALDKLMVGDARKDAVIGSKALATSLKGRHTEEVACFSADVRCADPIDPFFTSLGFDRIVLIQGGQDELGFKFRVVSYEPKSGKAMPATATNANLEKALLGALAKVVPAASTLEVKSTPPGATVFVDDVKVGVTPLSTQVLPGERVVRLDLKLHQPVEETIIIPIRGSASLDKTLEKVAARIVISASPPGTEIFIDGQLLGKDKVDRGILPGTHTIRLSADKYKAFEQQITVKADDQFVLDKSLEAIAAAPAVVGTGTDPAHPKEVKDTPNTVKLVTPPPTPPAPVTPADLIYDRRSWVFGSFEFGRLIGNSLVGRRWGAGGTGRTEKIRSGLDSRAMMGGSVEYGTGGKYFGVTVFGLSFLTNTDPWTMSIGYAKGAAAEQINGVTGPDVQDRVSVKMFTLRALQPQVRIALWRFMFSVQAGFEFRTGQITGMNELNNTLGFDSNTTFYRDNNSDGFMLLDLLAAGRINMRFYIVDGLFMFGQANATLYLVGEASDKVTIPPGMNMWGFNVGVGYGF